MDNLWIIVRKSALPQAAGQNLSPQPYRVFITDLSY